MHSKLFMTENGRAIKKENMALTKHHALLRIELAKVNGVLDNLNNQNSTLHKKIFEATIAATANERSTEPLLLADASEFRAEVLDLKNKLATISETSSDHTASFSSIEVNKKRLAFLMNVPSIQPIENYELTKLVSGFGKRINPFHKGNYHHPGADFAAARGTSVIATAKGTVVDLKNGSTLQAGYGNYIEIDHGNGIQTRYAHLDNVAVRIGQKVSKGFAIGTVGMSGGAVAPHVHYEILRKGAQVDPVPYLLENLNSKSHVELQKLGSKRNQSLD